VRSTILPIITALWNMLGNDASSGKFPREQGFVYNDDTGDNQCTGCLKKFAA